MSSKNKDRGIVDMRVDIDEALSRYYLTFVRKPEPGVKGTNRRISAIVVGDYADSMDEGEWLTTHQGIGFTGYFDDGTAVLEDGQHRLEGLVLANERAAAEGREPIVWRQALVTQGLSPEARRGMDVGKRRITADFLTMEGEMSATGLATIIKLCFMFEHVPYTPEEWRKFVMTPTMQAEYLEKNPRIREAPNLGQRLNRIVTPSSAGAFWYSALRVGQPEAKVNEFVHMLQAGNGPEWGEGNAA